MKKRPNILFIIMDSVRASNLSCYGYHRETTPNLDKFALQGAFFEQTISEGCWTLPVHASLFTGRFPINHGVNISKHALPENCETLPKTLKESGYQTSCFSNNPYISDATRMVQGFDTVEDIWKVSQPRGFERTRMSQLILQLKKAGAAGKPLIQAVQLMRKGNKLLKGKNKKKDSGAALTNDRIKHWFTHRWQKESPFFMFVNYMECHERYSPPHPYNRKFMPSRFSPWRTLQVSQDKRTFFSGSDKKREDDIEILKALYDGELNYLDHKIGELLQFLESLKIMDETFIVIAADHGDSLGEHTALGHRMTLYEPLVHVPMIIRYPSQFKPGTRISTQVQLSDLNPTFLQLAQIEREKNQSNGFLSIADLVNGKSHEFTIAENTAPKSLNNVVSRMIRTDQYKYIWKSNGDHELYNIKTDPAESVNLVNNEVHVASDMMKKLKKWEQGHKDGSMEENEAVYDDALTERLSALGYTN